MAGHNQKDGLILVHQGTKREPVNWQPSGTRATYYLADGLFVVRAQRVKSKEYMRVDLRRIDLLAAKEFADNAVLQLAVDGGDIVEMIMDNLREFLKHYFMGIPEQGRVLSRQKRFGWRIRQRREDRKDMAMFSIALLHNIFTVRVRPG